MKIIMTVEVDIGDKPDYLTVEEIGESCLELWTCGNDQWHEDPTRLIAVGQRKEEQ